MYISFEEPKINKSLNGLEITKIYAGVFESKGGKIVLEDLARASGMYRSNFMRGDSSMCAFLEGQRSMFLYICAKLEKQEFSNIEGVNYE